MANLIGSANLALYQLAFQYSPIILTGGLAASIPGGALPIIAITQPAEAASNGFNALLTGGNPLSALNILDPSKLFANFRPLPGGTLNSFDVGDYPFANQSVAANAMIAKALKLSMLMQTPVNKPGGFVSKLVTFSALKATIDVHVQLGGTFTILTPAFTYQNCLLLDLRDVTPEDPGQPQSAWQWDFYKPLLTLAQAQTALGNLMNKLSGGLPITSTAWSSVATEVFTG